jgi:hypothetical protein
MVVERSKPIFSYFMETFLILLVFAGGPLAVVALIVVGAVHRTKQRKALYHAANKYLQS